VPLGYDVSQSGNEVLRDWMCTVPVAESFDHRKIEVFDYVLADTPQYTVLDQTP
jgi:hypothetical protein